MRSKAPANLHVVKKEEKEARLRDFIEKDLVARRAHGSVGDAIYRLIALSTESPVARAIAALAPEAKALGIEIRAVFLAKDRSSAEGSNREMLPPGVCRIATDVRLVDAHEQLVLSDKTAWIGDCMRREPSKRDAFECYSEDCAATATWAMRSFEHIWSSAEPAKPAGRLVPQASETVVLTAAIAGGHEFQTVAALTLH